MSLKLAYLGIEATDVDQWSTFADLVGLQPIDGRDALFLRMDQMARRFIIFEGGANDHAFSGFEADDAAEFELAIARLRRAQISFEEGTAKGAELRAVDRYVIFRDLAGLQHEIALGCKDADTPFKPVHPTKGYVTGEDGMGHIAVNSSDYAACEEFFAKATGAKLSDHIFSAFGDSKVQVTFMHLNPRHHSIAYAQFPFVARKKIDHVMVEAVDLVDVLKTHERVVNAGVPVTISIGEHPNDHAVSFYCTTPSGFRLEVAANCIRVQPEAWKPRVYDHFSEWGHRLAG